MELYAAAFRATVVLVAASVLLAVPGFAGLGASLPLAAGFAGLGGVLFVFRDRLAETPAAAGHDLGRYGADLWLGPAVAVLVSLLALDATPGELQALGGLVGLAGMVNYFLRPVYRAGYTVFRTVAGAG